VVTSDAGLAARVRSLRNYGQARRDHAELPGINSRLDELQAAFLRVKLPRLEEWTKRREALAALYDADVGKIEGVRLPRVRKDARHVRHLYAIEAARRDALRAHLAARGIETLIHYPVPVHRQPAYAGARAAPGGLPRTEAWAAATLSLPLYPELREDEAARVAEAVRAFHQA
jgi:dTDP-4-amino-4,6-dideoxygalactose transaminase